MKRSFSPNTGPACGSCSRALSALSGLTSSLRGCEPVGLTRLNKKARLLQRYCEDPTVPLKWINREWSLEINFLVQDTDFYTFIFGVDQFRCRKKSRGSRGCCVLRSNFAHALDHDYPFDMYMLSTKTYRTHVSEVKTSDEQKPGVENNFAKIKLWI